MQREAELWENQHPLTEIGDRLSCRLIFDMQLMQ